MRKILFRGKKCNGEWTYGYYVQADYSWHGYGKHKEWIVCSARSNGGWFALQEKHAVISETVGQYTGLTDKNGKKIFEGDIVKCTATNVDCAFTAVVLFGNPNGEYNWGFQLMRISGANANTDILLWVDMEETGAFIEVIGNIYDNPELIGGETNG